MWANSAKIGLTQDQLAPNSLKDVFITAKKVADVLASCVINNNTEKNIT
jgi:hypothetical protein